MILPEVNVLMYAMSPGFDQHERCSAWLEDLINGPDRFVTWEPILASVLRISTQPALFEGANADDVLEFLRRLRRSPNHVRLQPSASMWTIFDNLLRHTGLAGRHTTDALIAAAAIDGGCRLATFDRDFERFPGLDWFTP